MIQLFNLEHHTIDTSEFNHYLHGDVVLDLEKKIANYVGAQYACGISSATNAIFLTMIMEEWLKPRKITIPSMLPPVVANAIITSGQIVEFVDDVDWVGDSYILHKFRKFKVVDYAQILERNKFIKESFMRIFL